MLGRRGAAVLLDGGMGHQLKRMGVKIEGEVGTMQRFLGVALANEADPPMVRDAHLAYIDAGADVITTNNYAVVPAALELSPDYSGDSAELQRLVAAAGAAARAAVEARPERTVRVAGCLPPLHESYRADRVATFDENIKDYRLIASAIAPYADVLLCETMSTAEEGLAAATAACEMKLPVWVSWTLDEHEPKLRSGESIRSALEKLADAGLLPKDGGSGGAVVACMFNCTSPEVITVALRELVGDPLLPPSVAVGAYANGFVTAASGAGEYRDLSPDEYYTDFVSSWVDIGTDVAADGGDDGAAAVPTGAGAGAAGPIVGGCCGIFPEHIARVRQGIDDDGRTAGTGDC